MIGESKPSMSLTYSTRVLTTPLQGLYLYCHLSMCLSLCLCLSMSINKISINQMDASIHAWTKFTVRGWKIEKKMKMHYYYITPRGKFYCILKRSAKNLGLKSHPKDYHLKLNTNTVTHSKANRARLCLTRQPRQLTVSVCQ